MGDPKATPSLTAYAGLATVPREEVRFGVVLNGGVSLAVWMGGTVTELDRLVKAGQLSGMAAAQAQTDPYAVMLGLVGCQARADVITGTSAGGINGAALALAQVNRRAEISSLRDLWVEQGRIEALLRQPFTGSPSSLLRGDEYFLPALRDGLRRLADPADVRDAEEAPVDLSIMTTVLRGNQDVTVDSLGQLLPQAIHGGRFHWSRLDVPAARRAQSAGHEPGYQPRPGDDPAEVDPFSERNIERTAAALALASRSTASFPVAFEPSFVPVRGRSVDPSTGQAVVAPPTGPPDPLRPDMGQFVEEWGSDPTMDRSRFVVDGGALANTPTRAAVDAIRRLPAGGPVRRVMLLVYPHAPAPQDVAPDRLEDAPTLLASLNGLLGALTAQGSRTFVDELTAYNVAAAGRRGSRLDILASLGPQAAGAASPLEALSSSLYGHYGRLRRWRASRDLAQRKVETMAPPGASVDSMPGTGGSWSFERIRYAAQEAQSAMGEIPYVPTRPPTEADVVTLGPDATGWGWGVSGALAAADAAGDLLRQLVWVLPGVEPGGKPAAGSDGDSYATVHAARQAVTSLTVALTESRAATDDVWERNPTLRALDPNASYWTLRLASYAYRMVGGPRASDTQLEAAIGAAAANDQPLAERIRTALLTHTDGTPVRPGAAGQEVLDLVRQVAQHVVAVLPVLRKACEDMSESRGLAQETSFRPWLEALGPTDRQTTAELVLLRLLQLEVVSTSLGDEVQSGSTIPIELVQLSAQTANAFTVHSRTADDKLAGMSINRFGGFLKRSWRVNDWIWGRVDSATILCRTILVPSRLRRAAMLSGYLAAYGDDPRAAAQATVDEVIAGLIAPTGLGDDPRVEDLRERAIAEVAQAFDLPRPDGSGRATGDLTPSMPALAALFAWAVHLRAVPDELSTLTKSIRADRVDGANRRSRGETFLESQAPLIARYERQDRADGAAVDPTDRAAALSAFDAAGIGREPLREEVGSDLTIRSLTTAAAVGATVVDSKRAGLSFARPITRVLRGVMLVGFWAVSGLTSRSVIARGLTLLGLAVGAMLLALSLFGVLPQPLAGPAAAIGASALFVAFAYGAVRSGTLLHSLVLVTPVVPLVAYALSGGTGKGGPVDPAAQDAAFKGGVTLLSVLGLAVGLMLLGSLPATPNSVWTALVRLADRVGVPRYAERSTNEQVKRLASALRPILGLLKGAVLVVASGLWLLVPVAIAYLVIRVGTDAVAHWIQDNQWWWIPAAVACTLIGMAAAYDTGRRLQTLRRALSIDEATGADVESWEFGTVTNPLGAQSSWAVVYGAGYFAVAVVISLGGLARPWPWVVTLLVTCLALGVFLTLVLPLVAPFLAMRGLERAELARDASVGTRFALPPTAAPSRSADDHPSAATLRRAYAVDLAERGVGFRWVVSGASRAKEPPPSLERRGIELLRRLDEARAEAKSSWARRRMRRWAWRFRRR